MWALAMSPQLLQDMDRSETEVQTLVIGCLKDGQQCRSRTLFYLLAMLIDGKAASKNAWNTSRKG